jgi:lambda family phage minor tail protein L
MAVPFSDLQAIAPSAVIELFQLELNTTQHGVNETYYFHAGVNADDNGNIVWDGQEYLRYPIEATDFEYTGTGSLPRPKLRVSNIFGTITALILSLPNGLEGAKVTRIRTLARYIDGVNFPGGTNPLGTPDPTAEFPREIYYIDRKAGENRDLVEFELAAAFDLVGVRAPKRQCVSNVCQWIYRGPECGYVGNAFFNFNDQPVGTIAQDVCGKRLNSCELRFAQQRFPGNVTSGSNVITMDQAASFSTGGPVTGFGLPASTTVSSVSGNLVTVSQNATATTTVSGVTGTIQTNLSQIIVASATGLAPGMTVTGSYLQPNTQVTAVAGTTITIGTPADFGQFLSFALTDTAANDPFDNRASFATDRVYFDAPASFQVGQYIRSRSGSVPLTRGARVISILSAVNFGVSGASYTVAVLDTTYIYQRGAQGLWDFYDFGAIPAATYNFAAIDRNYTLKANVPIPYGSYPGVGAFFT